MYKMYFPFIQLLYRFLLLALRLFQYAKHALQTLFKPTLLSAILNLYDENLIDRPLANGLQAFAGERYTRKIRIGDCMSSPLPTHSVATQDCSRKILPFILIQLIKYVSLIAILYMYSVCKYYRIFLFGFSLTSDYDEINGPSSRTFIREF